ncbi:MAG: EamA family transporter [Armatimonadota bacterium]|nr:DMT family transporter [bacterium]
MLRVGIALGLAIFFGAIGDILMSKGMQENGEVSVRHISDLPKVFKLAFSERYVLLGAVSMTIYFGSYVAALAWIDVSVANPLTALSYLIASAYAAFVMRERIGFKRAAGTLMIVLGAILVGLSS